MSHGSECQEHADRIVMWVAVALVIGAIVKTLGQLPYLDAIPFSVSMLVSGLVVGGINMEHDLGVYGKAVDAMIDIDAHLFLMIFIPPVIFESAYKSNFHLMRRIAGQALILAVPGVVISLILIAVIARYFFDYGWGWYTALMFGSILSATDPVAVVSILGSLGASKQLSTLIEGESLFNDGSAYVLFLLWKDYVTGDYRDAGEAIVYVIRLSLGAVALGLGTGLLTCSWLYLVEDPVAETAITLSSAYLTFYIAESNELKVHVSGVLSVVILGLTLSRYRTVISRKSEEALNSFWESIAAFFDLLIFFLTGILVAEKLFEGPDRVRGRDVGYLFMLYILLHVVRAIAVGLLSPWLAVTGYGFDWKIGTIVTYGGLRGAVSLALGLIVELEGDIDSQTKSRTLFLVSGIVFLTILINGTTAGYVLRWLGLTDSKASERRALRLALMTIFYRADSVADAMMRSPYYYEADWRIIRQRLPNESAIRLINARREKLRRHMGVDKIASLSKKDIGEEKKQETDIEPKWASVRESELNDEVRHRLLTQMCAEFRMDYEEHFLSEEGYDVLNEATAQAIDRNDLNEVFDSIEKQYTPRFWIRIVERVSPSLAQTLLVEQLGLAVEMTLSFVHACDGFNELRGVFGGSNFCHHVDNLEKEVLSLRSKSINRLKHTMKDTRIWTSIQTKKSLLVLHAVVDDTIKDLHAKGFLLPRERARLKEMNDRSLRRLEATPAALLQLKDTWPREAFAELLFWVELGAELQSKLADAPVLLFKKGDQIFDSNEMKRGGMLIITDGVVDITNNERVDTLSISGCLGIWDVCHSLDSEEATPMKRLGSSAVVQTRVLAGHYISPDLCRSMLKSPAGDGMWKLAAVSALHLMVEYKGFVPCRSDLERLCAIGTLHRVGECEKKFDILSPTLLLKGRAHSINANSKNVQEGGLIEVQSSFPLENKDNVIQKSENKNGNSYCFEPNSIYLQIPGLELAVNKKLDTGSVGKYIPGGITYTRETLKQNKVALSGTDMFVNGRKNWRNLTDEKSKNDDKKCMRASSLG